MENLELVLPEIFISLSIMFLLILGVFKKHSSRLIQNISLLVLLITAVITFNETLGIDEVRLFNGSVIVDYLSSFMKIATLITAFLVLVISSNYLRSLNIFKIETDKQNRNIRGELHSLTLHLNPMFHCPVSRARRQSRSSHNRKRPTWRCINPRTISNKRL